MTEIDFLEQLDRAFLRFRQPMPTRDEALICVLVDHWQDLREEYGYVGLFTLRRQIRSLLASHFGDSTIVLNLSESGLVALVSGEAKDALESHGQALFEALGRKAFKLGSDQVAITVTAGYCPFDLRFTDASRMLTETVATAEECRRKGGNEWVPVSASISAAQASSDKRRMLGLLMQSLRNNRVQVVFQALLATHGHDAHCFQILPRLRAADGELIAAADFLPVARSANLLATLDRWMIAHAIRLLSDHHRHDPIRLFVSQADEMLVDEKRRNKFIRQVDDASVLDNRLVLDFHLGDAMAHLSGAEKTFAMMQDKGIGICLSLVDDHSSWELLENRLRCDYLRMAPDFVRRIAYSDDIAHELDDLTRGVRKNGTKIIMPMIEDAGAAAHLWSSAVDYLQGNVIQPAQERIQLGD